MQPDAGGREVQEFVAGKPVKMVPKRLVSVVAG
jgi:hypothetical protein